MIVVMGREGRYFPEGFQFPAAFQMRVTMPYQRACNGSKYVLKLLGNLSLAFLQFFPLPYCLHLPSFIQDLAFLTCLKRLHLFVYSAFSTGHQKSELALG